MNITTTKIHVDMPSEGKFVEIYLNGETVDDVIEADNLKGYVVRYKRDEEGNFYKSNGITLEREFLYGDVEIRFLPRKVK